MCLCIWLLQVSLVEDDDFGVEPIGASKTIMSRRVGSAQKERGIAWLGRGSKAKRSGITWRPKKIHRKAARRWCREVDNALRQGTTIRGLGEFAHDVTPRWSPTNWATWPSLSISLDHGSDGFAAVHALQYALSVNLTVYPDPSHGAHRDFILLLQALNLWPMWALMLVSWNLPHGPEDDDLRFNQIRTTLSS